MRKKNNRNKGIYIYIVLNNIVVEFRLEPQFDSTV